MNKKVFIEDSEISEYVKNFLISKNVEFVKEGEGDFEIYFSYPRKSANNSINVHPSLLPAFDCEDAINRAFMAGVKVSGVTITCGDKIIAQYPVLIGLDTHYEEFKRDVIEVEKRLIPPVIEAILEDRIFDFQDLFRSPCAHKGGCSGCHKNN